MFRHAITVIYNTSIGGYRLVTKHPRRYLIKSSYHTSKSTFDAEPSSNSTSSDTNAKVNTGQIYNNRRAAYMRAVGNLRKQYAKEVLEQRKFDEKIAAEKKAAQTRKRLERQRLKDIRSVKNALLQEEERTKRHEEFQRELEIAHINRNARKGRYDKARRLILNELQEESAYWLSTPKEVDAAFGRDAVQQLWTNLGGYIGAPMPSDDSDYWKFQSHTWDMSKNFISPREILLEEIEEEGYYEVNVDSKYWTKERLLAKKELREKAKLRALVREEGRKVLLMKQRRMMQDVVHEAERATKEEGMMPTPPKISVPSLHVLGNTKAMEKEGAKILEEDPTKFFRFEGRARIDDDGNNVGLSDEDKRHLGKPIRLADPLRDSSPTGTPYPLLIGRIPKPDTRTEREKKRDEREEKMWAAAEEASAVAVEFAAEDDIHTGFDPVDYDELGNRGDDVDVEWEEGLDAEKDAETLAIPREERYSKEDIEWVLDQLKKKISVLKDIEKADRANAMQKTLTKQDIPKVKDIDAVDESDIEEALGKNVVKGSAIDERGREYTSYDVLDGDYEGTSVRDVVDIDYIESVLDSLTDDQREALESLETGDNLSLDEMKATLSKVPGLSDEQVQSLMELEVSLSQDENLLKELEKLG